MVRLRDLYRHISPTRIKTDLLVLFTTIATTVVFTSCEKFLDVPAPKNQLSTEKVFKDSISATNAIVGIYSNMLSGQNGSIGKIVPTTGMTADELNTSLTAIDFLINEIQVGNSDVNTMWGQYHTFIYEANAILEGLEKSNTVTESLKKQILGEAKFLRGWCYLYLTSLWGDVPLIVSTDYRISMKAPRSSRSLVMTQVIEDLKDAKSLLTDAYLVSDKTRPNKSSAIALLSRAYLYNRDWENAERESQTIIDSKKFTPLPALGNVFKVNSRETIWQLKAVNTLFYTPDGILLIPGTATIVPNYIVTDTLLSAFEPNDQRKTTWLNSNSVSGKRYYYPFKYTVRNAPSTGNPTEFPVMIRMSEIYLIHAEASANQNKIDQAKSDLNIIRLRAGLKELIGNYTMEQIKAAVEHERRVELFIECGHRWVDMKRTSSLTATGLTRADDLLSKYKPTFWQSTDILWPIPNEQRSVNPALTQNNGY